MEDQVLTFGILLSFLGVLLGAVIVSVTSLRTTKAQTRAEHKRERFRLAVEAGIADFQRLVDIAKQARGSRRVAPLSAYIYYHVGLLDLLDTGGINRESLRELDRQQSEFLKIVEDVEAGDQQAPPGTSSGG